MKKTLLQTFLLSVILSVQLSVNGQTLGLMDYQAGSLNGYTLFSPFFSKTAFLIDNCGRVVNKWEGDYFPAVSLQLTEYGELLRTSSSGIASNPVFAFGGGGEKIQRLGWDGTLLWEFSYSDSTHRIHHDFVLMPNGNLLMPAWELKTADEAIAAGRDPDLLPDGVLWAEYVIEVDPTTGEIVWEWHLWDHLVQDFDATKNNFGVIAEHPGLFDINLTGGPTANGGKNQLHINSIDYNPMMDQVLINSFFISELYIIDHSTTTSQAASHSGGNSGFGGDLLYRWGNPQNYDHGTADDRTIYGAHHVHWIPDGLDDAGKIMFFHNGNGRPDGSYSSVDIIVPPVDDYITGRYIYDPGVAYAPAAAEWSYVADPPESFYSNFLSSAQRLSNGNTLICSGANGRFFEINKDKEIVWEYINPAINGSILSQGDTVPVINGRNANIVFRCTRYEPGYPGLLDADLTPGDPIELDFPQPYDCEIISGTTEEEIKEIFISPNPTADFIKINVPQLQKAEVLVFDIMGRAMDINELNSGQLELDVSAYPQGLYFIKIEKVGLRKIVVGR
ncbi:MAG TPA: T9SS type A sorting domain-containing protein [Bacteroidetes bacterium]|nr:T9SS type A sorting domain-containing protein [Bacteroidota bacterium]